MLVDYKAYRVNSSWGIECYTDRNPYTNEMSYRVDVVMLGVPWLEVVESYIVHDKDEANKIFLVMAKKYRL